VRLCQQETWRGEERERSKNLVADEMKPCGGCELVHNAHPIVNIGKGLRIGHIVHDEDDLTAREILRQTFTVQALPSSTVRDKERESERVR
jgi:hypothetical protein